jgi:hypothetical protein
MSPMSRISISTIINRSPSEVWDDVRHIDSHVNWMADAYEIRFASDQQEGVGTRFECETRVGPLRTTDVMEITAWEPERRMGVRHSGVVTGEGAFTLVARSADQTEFRWEEDLRFPWWLAGRLGELVGRPVLTAIWRRNLERLRRRLDPASPAPAGG